MTTRRVPLRDVLYAAVALVFAVVAWVVVIAGDRGIHGAVAATCFSVAALAVPVRRTAVIASALVTMSAFAALVLSGSASALGVFPLIALVPLTVAAVADHSPRRWHGIVALVLATAAAPASPAVHIAGNKALVISLHMAVVVVVYLWASRRRLERDSITAARDRAVALARAAERERIADELHDGLGQALTAIRATSSTAGATARRRPESAIEALGVVADLSRDALVELRRSVAEIASVASLSEIVDRAGKSGRVIECTTPRGGDIDAIDESLADDVRDVVRRILREAVTNAVRHGDPDDPILIDLRSEPDGLVMTVTNGIRDAAVGEGSTTGRGRESMIRRAAEAGGRCTSEPGGDGWVVRLHLPGGRAD